MTAKNDPAKIRELVLAVAPWLRGETEDIPAREALADACRATARALAGELEGHAVELRVPPFVAVQCVAGPRHTRGTPANVVEMDPETWLQLATGMLSFPEALESGKVDASGSRARELGQGLPVIAI